MQSIIQELDTAIRAGRSTCFTALVETRGSTPQKAGAAMLVFPDGSQVGTLGGGCVEAEVKRRALQVLQDGSTELLTFQLDSDYGWDDGLICGGRMKMLVDPIRAGDQATYYSALKDLISAGQGATEAVVIDAEKSGGGSNADRWLLDEAGAVIVARTRGNDANSQAALPTAVAGNLKHLDERPRPYLVSGVSFLPHLKRCKLIIVGAGHVGQKVADLAADVGFEVWVADDRQEYCNPERFPRARRLVVNDFERALRGLEIDSSTYCIIVTRGHHHDEQALFHLATSPARYVGMIGSRRKIKLIFDDLQRDGIPREALQRVHAPLGFDIGSQTVPEIAVSIVAELIAHRNLGRLPDRPRPPAVLED